MAIEKAGVCVFLGDYGIVVPPLKAIGGEVSCVTCEGERV